MEDAILLFAMLNETTLLNVIRDMEAIDKDCSTCDDTKRTWLDTSDQRHNMWAFAVDELQSRINGRNAEPI